MELLLYIHIAGAVFTGLLAITSIIALIKKSGNFKLLRRSILAIGSFQIVSGAALIAFGPEISLTRVCIVSLAYLGAVAGIEYGLRSQIKRATALN